MSTEGTRTPTQGLSVAALLYGIFLLIVLLLAVGMFGGIGVFEELLWLLLVAAWVTFWMVKRRR